MIDIVITKRRDDLHAQVKDHPELWAAGRNYYEVLGNLMMIHNEYFGGIRVEYEGKFYGSD